MKRNIFGTLFLLSIFALACSGNKNPVEKQDRHKEISEQEIPRIMKMTLDEALSIYGNTVEGYGGKDIEFVLTGSSFPEFGIELYNIYKPEQYENNIIIIKEVTWKYGLDQKITVWYEKKNNAGYFPVFHKIYFNDTQF